MPRNPELDKLLREVDSLTSSTPQTEETQEVEEVSQPTPAKKGSSFLDAVGGFFISKVEEEETHQQVDTPPPTPNTVAEVAESVPPPQFTQSSTSTDYSNRPFADIYKEARVDESSFTVDKLFSLLQDPSLKDQPLSTKTLVLKMALKAQNVEPTVPVTDAVTRDRALDAYQKMLNTLAAQTETENSQKIQQINDEVRKYLEAKNAEMDALRTQTAEIKRQAESFASRRLQEEQRLAEIILPLLEGQPNPVSVGNKVD
ncbi:MAG TPA: hypothetical protein PKY82_31565 [Pyrinomonadaceae bacterium]|nr:hypothetical protein [Pyrinomonadaceae bacterium]